MSEQRIWSADHPHANDKTWTQADGAGNFARTRVWGWCTCRGCSVKIAAVVGAAGEPCCEVCP